MPAAPATAPVIVIDRAKLKVFIRSYPKGLAAGLSGWTVELLLPLLEDDTCLHGIALLVQLISNNQLDLHNRCLLTTFLLLGIPKPESDALPPGHGRALPQAGGQVLPQHGQRQPHGHL
jgi:hypothetical protein